MFGATELQWSIICGQRDEGTPLKPTDLRAEERIKAREREQQKKHTYENNFESVKLK